MEGMGEEKLYCPLWKSVKHQKAALGRRVSANFVVDCSWYKMHHSAIWNYNKCPFQFPERPAIKSRKKKTFYSYKLMKLSLGMRSTFSEKFAQLPSHVAYLKYVVFEKRLSTGCEESSQKASSFLCLESTLLVMLSGVFTLKETICLKL